MSDKDKTVSFRLASKDVEKLDARAKSLGQTRSDYLHMVMTRELEVVNGPAADPREFRRIRQSLRRLREDVATGMVAALILAGVNAVRAREWAENELLMPRGRRKDGEA